MDKISRRRMLEIGVASSIALGTRIVLAAEGSAPVIRRNVNSSMYTQLPDYIKGVTVMKSRQRDDPLSWIFQANTHGILPGTMKPANAQGVWDTCEHSSWYFLPWHRAYLYYFERILRAASGNPDLTLPYWDWSTKRSMPNDFYSGTLNELRDLQLGEELRPTPLGPSGLVVDPVLISYALSRATFGGSTSKLLPGSNWQLADFTWQLELLPHNIIHSLIGGLMGDPATAAGDPIFWLHHCNIDRLWNIWLADPTSNHANPTDPTWFDQPYAFYDVDSMDPSKAVRVEKTLRDHLSVANTASRYDTDGAENLLVARLAIPIDNRSDAEREAARKRRSSVMIQPPSKSVASSAPRPWELGAEPLHLDVDISPEPARQALMRVASASPDALEKNRIFLVVKGIKFDRSPGVAYAVYLNLPNPNKPEEAYQIGFLDPFTVLSHRRHETMPGHGEAQDVNSLKFDVTRLVHQLQQGQSWNPAALKVSFFAVRATDKGGKPKPPATKITFEAAELHAQ